MTYGLGLRTRALSLAANHEEAGRNQTADVLNGLATENDNLREALRRVREWFDAGATGALPELLDCSRSETPAVRPCGHALGRTRWCPDCELAERE